MQAQLIEAGPCMHAGPQLPLTAVHLNPASQSSSTHAYSVEDAHQLHVSCNARCALQSVMFTPRMHRDCEVLGAGWRGYRGPYAVVAHSHTATAVEQIRDSPRYVTVATCRWVIDENACSSPRWRGMVCYH